MGNVKAKKRKIKDTGIRMVKCKDKWVKKNNNERNEKYGKIKKRFKT